MENIIQRYLSGTATEQEKQQLLHWLEQQQANRDHFKKSYDLWLYSHALLTDDADLEAALRRFNSRTAPSIQPQRRSLSTFSRYLLRIAASLLLLFSAGYVGYSLRGKPETTVAIHKLLTGENGKGEYILPDGSTVWLNANSRLEYPEQFAEGNRRVRLEGEALFEVTRDRNRPFFVEAGGVAVEVLGTRFLVNNYSNKQIAEAVLINGKVKLEGDYLTEPLLMVPGEMISYNKQSHQMERSRVDTEDYTNWIHTKLVFDKTNLSRVIINLEKWYGVEIEAAPELLATTHLSFTIRRESLEEVLSYISLTSPISYSWKEDVLYLSAKR